MLIFAIHPPQADRLARIVAQMRELGRPRIRAIDCGDHCVALEGSHRLAAASVLGLSPELILFCSDELIDIRGFDWYDAARWPSWFYPAGEIASELRSLRSVGYGFRSAGMKLRALAERQGMAFPYGAVILVDALPEK